jgi:hypothetical protein
MPHRFLVDGAFIIWFAECNSKGRLLTEIFSGVKRAINAWATLVFNPRKVQFPIDRSAIGVYCRGVQTPCISDARCEFKGRAEDVVH